MKIKTANLIDKPLDWAVAKVNHTGSMFWNGDSFVVICAGGKPYAPSTEWSQGGPIIEREKIWLKFPFMCEGEVEAVHGAFGFPNIVNAFGPTPLIAVMRCYVASKLGDEVEIPNELC